MTFLDILSELWQTILRTAWSSLLSVLIFLAIAVFWARSRNYSLIKRMHRARRAIVVFLILALITPVFLLLTRNALVLLYLKELLLSGVFLVSVSITLKIINRMERNKAKKEEQLLSWRKWQQSDVIGWHELWEEICFAGELHSTVRRAVKEELRRVQQETSHPQSGLGKNGQYEKSLKLLLMSPREVGKLSTGEDVPEKEISSPGYVHSDAFSGHIAEKAQGVV